MDAKEQDHIREVQKAAFAFLILPVFQIVLERSLVWCCLSLPAPKLGQKVLLLLLPVSSKHAPPYRRCRVVKQWEVKPSKIVNALQAMLLSGLVRSVLGTSGQVHLTSVPKIVISTSRRHILRCRAIVFTNAGLLCQWSKLQPIGPLTRLDDCAPSANKLCRL